ncbi:hypothetical protein LOTGIDRAFT_228048 [Lottia gigantea]|uniref:Uncharacterized protein n=1 Tax=Lottia gigantea TaxID=225164 RepID=V4B4R3_LOTGI|nr:hypothetical protein LOTGIDRAFT_228048 [Lottia gigantea]ESP05473.1 hypothetical protein LOTGIDRAFT_228048 [Lottia gigantea]
MTSKSSKKRNLDNGKEDKLCKNKKSRIDVYDVVMPREIKVYRFAESRASEINALLQNIHHIGGNRVIFQKLPRHLRRRAMSHNIKRLPRRLREAALIEYKNRPETGTKRPSRKHRRRPKNLLADYVRRQRRVKWLETHIWHAKRFHMTEKWGYKLPVRPTDRSYRACYRATVNHCLLQDVSYECCIEICGYEDVIIQCFSHLLTNQTGSTIGGAAVIKGNRQGQNMLYSYEQYPEQAVGQVSFLWNPEVISQQNKLRQVWLWCHPSCYSAIWYEITNAFQSENLLMESVKMTENCLYDKQVKIGETIITSLKDNLVKFRLTGPLSHTILIDSLKPAQVGGINCQDSWWQKYYKSKAKQSKGQVALWKELQGCQSPAEVPPRMILPLTVRDPRLFLPDKKTKLKLQLEGLNTNDIKSCLPSPDLLSSPLWNLDIRKEVKETKITDAELNKMRSHLVVPGSALELGEKESRIPVLLIQRPGNQQSDAGRLGYGSGWDIVVPSGWGMAFHIAFVYRGGRTGGLQEAESLNAEMGALHSPSDQIDTPAGKAEQTKVATELLDKYKRYPPDKCPNYFKLGVPSPFSCSWNGLVKAWKDQFQDTSDFSDQFYVLRNKKELRNISKVISKRLPIAERKEDPECEVLEQMKSLLSNHVYALIPVQITVRYRGIPSKFSHVCIPSTDDLKLLSTNSKYGGPTETLHEDHNKGQQKVKNKKSRPKKKRTEFLPSDTVDLTLNDRKTIGFVNCGRFVFGQGQGSGLAFCSLLGLNELMNRSPFNVDLCVLIRNPTSLQYRFASLSIHV